MPTPPDRWTFLAIWAHDPTVAQSCRPWCRYRHRRQGFTKDGIRTTPGADIGRFAPRCKLGKRRESPASFHSFFFQSANLLVDLVPQVPPCGPPSCFSMSFRREAQQHGFLGPLVYMPVAILLPLCHAQLARCRGAFSVPIVLASIASRASPLVSGVDGVRGRPTRLQSRTLGRAFVGHWGTPWLWSSRL